VLIGFTIFCLGLLLSVVSAIAIAQGVGVPSVIGLLLLGLALIVIGDQIYRRRKRKLINKRQAAQLFGVTEGTIERWLKDGKLPTPKKFFWSRRWDSDELMARRKFKPTPVRGDRHQ
jgi:predicted DNA-binding transcriptional regulator AlpA